VQTVVITGASTGIGAAIAGHLAANGFRVFAGVRRKADGATLRERTRGELRPVLLDVTDEPSIAAAATVVAEAVGGRGLAGLVNNAGVVKPAPLEVQPLADFREQLEVNLCVHPLRCRRP
jgi:NAD(P)-dependent dehydrogenase (short-subunit alcohol dehydrogenase family)